MAFTLLRKRKKEGKEGERKGGRQGGRKEGRKQKKKEKEINNMKDKGLFQNVPASYMTKRCNRYLTLGRFQDRKKLL